MVELRETINSFVKHLSDISFNHIEVSRMTLYFKKDKNSRMTFLYCTSLRENRKNNSKQKPMLMESTLKVII